MSLKVALVRDWWQLTKPRLNFLVLLTALAGYALAPKNLPTRAHFWPLAISIWALAASAAMLNMWLESDSDAKMERTRDRPLAAGRLPTAPVFWAGQVLAWAALAALVKVAGWTTGLLGMATWVSYLAVYTPLKRITPLSVLVGAVPGALPPVMGWTAGGGELNHEALGLFCLLFVWQMPHFLAIATLYGEQYRMAGIKVLGLEHGQAVVGRQIVIYAASVLAVSLWLWRLGLGGNLYAAVAVILGLVLLGVAIWAALRPSRSSARVLLLTSVTYLPLLFWAMIADQPV